MHTLANLSDAPARYLLVITPAGFERRFDADPDGPVPETVVVGPPISRRADRALPQGDARINVLAAQRRQRRAVSLMDNRVGAGSGAAAAPPRLRRGVLRARRRVDVPARRRTDRAPPAGELAFARRGVHHTFANLSGAEARQLIVCTPAGFERYFQRIAAQIAGVDPPPEALEPWPDVTKVGPPLST